MKEGFLPERSSFRGLLLPTLGLRGHLRQKLIGVNLEGFGYVEKFDNVQSALSAFKFGNKRLRAG